ncbi:MAG: hypothetical protein EZS28_006826 [Streblomastix strix]|uniref:Uncharacterized protein n=1 Tax=Streblomastix strix TaxID=222440 RepID=A0A5J4WTE3_9EUKA|nr:MAG: hypothetical protein EZS28_006826 [Streblomastix strix]
MEQEELALLLLHKQIRTIEQSKIQENNFAEENLNEVAMITAAMSDAQQQEIEEKQREIRINLPKTYTIPESGSSVAVRRRGTKEEPELKKQRKQEVKRSKQEKRQIKIPKAMKHRAIAQSKKK